MQAVIFALRHCSERAGLSAFIGVGRSLMVCAGRARI
jgi:hypothetical protein